MSNLPPHVDCHFMERLLFQRLPLIALTLGNIKEMWSMAAKWMGDDHQGSGQGARLKEKNLMSAADRGQTEMLSGNSVAHSAVLLEI